MEPCLKTYPGARESRTITARTCGVAAALNVARITRGCNMTEWFDAVCGWLSCLSQRTVACQSSLTGDAVATCALPPPASTTGTGVHA